MSAGFEDVVEDVIEAYRLSSRSLWTVARGVWELFDRYGMYERDFTAILSHELSVGIDTIYHWRKAWDTLAAVRAVDPGFSQAGLSISHFYVAADYVERQGAGWVLDWLVAAQEARWSSRRLAAEMGTATNDSGTLPWLRRRMVLISAQLERVYQSAEAAGLDDTRRRRLGRVLALLDGIK